MSAEHDMELDTDDAPDLTTDSVPADALETTDDSAPAEDDSDASVAPVAGAAPAVEVEPPTPFAVNVFGQPYQIPGATWNATAKTLAVSDDKSFARVQQLLTKGREYETRGRQQIQELERRVQQKEQAGSADQRKAQAFLAELQKLAEGTEQDAYDFAMGIKQNWPLLTAQAERDFLTEQLHHAQTASAPPAPDVDQLIEQAREGVSALVEDVLQNQPWATPDAKAALIELMSDVDTMDRFVRQTARDLPERGVRAGQWVADWDVAARMLEHFAKPYQHAHKQMASAAQRVTSVSTVATNNAKALAAANRQRTAQGTFVAEKPTPSKPKPIDVSKKWDQDWQNILAGR